MPDPTLLSTAETQRLLQKGRRLYGRCLRKHDTLCVTGFVDHQLTQGHADLVAAYRDWLATRQPDTVDAQRLTAELLTTINGRLSHE